MNWTVNDEGHLHVSIRHGDPMTIEGEKRRYSGSDTEIDLRLDENDRGRVEEIVKFLVMNALTKQAVEEMKRDLDKRTG